MGYAEAIKVFLINFRWLFIVGAALGGVYAIHHDGYTKGVDETNTTWNTLEKLRIKKVDDTLKEAHEVALAATLRSEASAQFIEEEYNAKVDKVKELATANSVLESSSLRQRSLCSGRSENGMSTGGNTKVPTGGTIIPNAGFSREFQDFIGEKIVRDKELVNWVQSAVKEVTLLCKQPNVKC